MPPFTVLVDGNFVHAVTTKNYDVEEHLSRILDVESGRCAMVTTGSVYDELRTLASGEGGDAFKPSCAAASRLKRLRVGGGGSCNDSLTPAESILKLIGQHNRHKYVVATQDAELQAKLRKIPGVPIVFFARAMLIMEAPSDASNVFYQSRESKKLAPKKEERRALEGIQEHPKEGKKPSRKKRKGPKQQIRFHVRKQKRKSRGEKRLMMLIMVQVLRERKKNDGGSGSANTRDLLYNLFST